MAAPVGMAVLACQECRVHLDLEEYLARLGSLETTDRTVSKAGLVLPETRVYWVLLVRDRTAVQPRRLLFNSC